jgi:LPXTG-motif cell wall-anchored protein
MNSIGGFTKGKMQKKNVCIRRPGWRMVIIVYLLGSMLFQTGLAHAAEISIMDRANVLEDSRIKEAASSLAYPLKIYTMNDFKGSKRDFVRAAEKQITAKNQIVFAIETRMREIAIVSGKEVKLSATDLEKVADTLEDTYEQSGNYTSATLAALERLPKAGGTNWGVIFLVGGIVVVVGAALLYFLWKRRQDAQSHEAQAYTSVPAGDPSLYHQSPYPTPAPYSAPEPEPPALGMNPLVAAGLGAAAGGLVGYALGSQQKEAQPEEENLVGASVSEDIDEEDMSFHGAGRDFGAEESGGFVSDDETRF